MKAAFGLLVHGCLPGEALKRLAGRLENNRVLVTEGRPLLLGAQRTAPDLLAHGLAPTLISDNMVAYCLAQGLIEVVTIGYWEEEVGGLICPPGALGVAICAAHHNVPVCALPDENRVSAGAGDLFHFVGQRVAAPNVEALVPASDWVPRRWISRIFEETIL